MDWAKSNSFFNEIWAISATNNLGSNNKNRLIIIKIKLIALTWNRTIKLFWWFFFFFTIKCSIDLERGGFEIALKKVIIFPHVSWGKWNKWDKWAKQKLGENLNLKAGSLKNIEWEQCNNSKGLFH